MGNIKKKNTGNLLKIILKNFTNLTLVISLFLEIEMILKLKILSWLILKLQFFFSNFEKELHTTPHFSKTLRKMH